MQRKEISLKWKWFKIRI